MNATARPGCYPWQGKVISTQGRSGVTHDLDDKPIPFYSIHDTTYGQPDGLWGINCHHGPPNVFLPGLSSIRGEVPSAEENAAAYALTQRQRQLERQVRYAKREAAMLDAAGDKEGFDQAALRVKQRQQALRDFAEANNLPLDGDRTQVMGYNRSVAGKVTAAVRPVQAGTTVDGLTATMTRHAMDRAKQRGVTIDAIRDAVSHPLTAREIRTDASGRQSRQFIGAEATVVINPATGNVISVWPTHTRTRKKYSKEE